MNEDDYISAGDLEKYGYCPLSWWRGLKGIGGDESTRNGIKEHARIGGGAEEIASQEVIYHRAEGGVLWFAVGATLIALIGVTFLEWETLSEVFSKVLSVLSLIWLLTAVFLLYSSESVTTKAERMLAEKLMVLFAMGAATLAVLAFTFYHPPDTIFSRVLEVLALLWLIGASFFLYRSMRHLEHAKQVRKELGITNGKIEYVDGLDENTELLTSPTLGLRGRPDYILMIDHDYVPVEVKTGRTPKGPLFSHILQIAAYCMLVEEKYGKAPHYGVIKYPTIEHEIEFDDELRSLVTEKVKAMREILKTGEAHRNHNRKGKCAKCSRREGCPERLDK